jgi:tripartite-type tricarboxylate transporter receptor subunit TctC
MSRQTGTRNDQVHRRHNVNRRIGALLFQALGWALLAGSVSAQDFPTKPVSIVVPFPPGGAAANIPTIVAEKVSRDIGSRIIIEHKPGAGSLIGTLDVKRGPKDGYRMLMLASTLAATLAVRDDPGVTIDDFVPVVRLAKDYFVIVAGPALKAKNLSSMREVIEYAKKNPGVLNVGSTGAGTTLHLGLEQIGSELGIKTTRVDYQGMAPIYTDLMGGRVEIMVDVLGNAMRYHGSNEVRIIAVAAPNRVESHSGIPTLKEMGMNDGVLEAWWGLAVPAGTPPNRIAFLEKAFLAAGDDKETRDKVSATGTIPTFEPGAVMQRVLERDYKMWSKVVKDHGITAK